VLCYDGVMIEKVDYFEGLLKILEKEVKEKLNYSITLIEKSMDTDWEPELLPEDVIFEDVNEKIVKSQGLYEISKDIQVQDLNNVRFPIVSNATMDALHKMNKKTCDGRLWQLVNTLEDSIATKYSVWCDKCQKIHPIKECENQSVDLYNNLRKNVQLYITQNNLSIEQCLQGRRMLIWRRK
jgi:hypothetical protein